MWMWPSWIAMCSRSHYFSRKNEWLNWMFPIIPEMLRSLWYKNRFVCIFIDIRAHLSGFYGIRVCIFCSFLLVKWSGLCLVGSLGKIFLWKFCTKRGAAWYIGRCQDGLPLWLIEVICIYISCSFQHQSHLGPKELLVHDAVDKLAHSGEYRCILGEL